MKDTGTLFVCEDSSSTDSHPLYGLQGLELTNIKPNYEAMIRGGHLKVTDMGVQHGMFICKNILNNLHIIKLTCK